ncbi:MAG: pyridoxamine 5'-phosphate oxidase family protein [Acidimicrobiia bacterium]
MTTESDPANRTTSAAHRLLPRDGSVVMFMLVRNADGRPTGYPMTGLFRDGELEITTYRKAAKARYLLADDRVCCVVADPDENGRGVALYGRAAPAAADGFLTSTGEGSRAAAIEVPDSVRETVRDRLGSRKRMVFTIRVDELRELGTWGTTDAR